MLIIFDFYLFVIFENRRLFCSLLAIADRKTNNGTGDDGVGNDDTAHWKRMNIQQTNDHWGGMRREAEATCVLLTLDLTGLDERRELHRETNGFENKKECRCRGHGRPDNACV